ncbi:rust resistance kinase Lr10-like isoform X1 [Dioscorea cayenensis subsp. rotundata]|uniref:Rust resistance kinase Lr10-like isoform X1 n=2 Tax=Dioscorea cayennensis subsp. rotundata TaxID=55577 RepID=A0AB40CRH4_DIOCR|nr:rust resistance kinase Lr10-like isoform X1 [Dioscorea cayenensis subsp. rotundata]
MSSTGSTQSTSQGSSDSSGLVWIIIMIGVLVTIGKIYFLYTLYQKHVLRKTNNSNPSPVMYGDANMVSPNLWIEDATVERFLKQIAKEKPIRFTFPQLAGITRNYTIRLGSGGFGIVYKGQLPNGVQVAVKVLNTVGSEDKRLMEQQFMAEIGTIGRTFHANLVKLYGFCYDSIARALIYEYMDKGSLDTYLFDKSHIITWEKLHEIAIGTAKALSYLHDECEQRIIHYDIKPANILLDNNFTPKVADFGLAKLCNRENTHVSMTVGRGTPGYAAPEMWMMGQVTYKCDVYSFGILLFEIAGRRRSFDASLEEDERWFPKWVWERYENGEMEKVLEMIGVDDEHKGETERKLMVALWCVQYQPERRPPMDKVVKMLEGEMEIVPPLNPFQHLLSTSAPSKDLWSGTSLSSSGADNQGLRFHSLQQQQQQQQEAARFYSLPV